jgi:hypothetical protein
MHQTDWLVCDAVEEQKRWQKTSDRLRIWADYTTLGAGCQIFSPGGDRHLDQYA